MCAKASSENSRPLSDSRQCSTVGFVEFVALMAALMSLVALSIDAMLPALGAIGKDLGSLIAPTSSSF